MPFPRFLLAFILSGLCLATGTVAQQTPGPSVDNDFVQKQFGSNCALIELPPLTADLDGDGVEDIVIPARCTSPMMDQAEENYVVVDPYNAFFGYGNPKITTQFATDDPARRGFSLLVIHGAGADAWHSATPKAKFMIVNVPFKSIFVKKMVVKKKERMAIYVDETGGDAQTSVLFWDGKKYRYEAMGSSME
ncbi:MAG TPA: hypothetical protein VEG68_15395 [Terriglobales bacterium]|nr:hypothetical protein [Terriglobales bacterium]